MTQPARKISTRYDPAAHQRVISMLLAAAERPLPVSQPVPAEARLEQPVKKTG
ncbi:hypothetical protein [Deinococcus sp. QL22]|uniref:hypothetical protein n=1 Tax=Deinococcus sp. QL22 TaxID=2939437 RepID=UPI002017BAB5|nr:hypothetical protein [Deinococcus sp. QL22]UQN06802.1 hypothetical protein M1R55_02440 [Deinococcus sp. QL22]